MKASPEESTSGFSLIEVLVAFVVLSLGVSVLIDTAGLVSTRTAFDAARERASDLSVLATIGAPHPDTLGRETDEIVVRTTDVGNGVNRLDVSVRRGTRTYTLRTAVPDER